MASLTATIDVKQEPVSRQIGHGPGDAGSAPSPGGRYDAQRTTVISRPSSASEYGRELVHLLFDFMDTRCAVVGCKAGAEGRSARSI